MYIFRWMSILIVLVVIFCGYRAPLLADVEKEELLYHTTKPDMSRWEVENSWDFIVGNYFVGIQHNLRDSDERMWGARFELSGIDDPVAYAWLDVGFNLRVGLMGENGIMVGDRISYDILEDADVFPPRGIVHARLYDAHDAVIAERTIETYLVPVPRAKSGCKLEHAVPWLVKEAIFGRTIFWKCGEDRQIYMHIHQFETILEFWNTGGKENITFVAMTLENGHRIAAKVYDTLPILTTDDEEGGTLTVQLLVNEKFHQRKIILPKKP